jgi:hypothetical protein
VISDFPPVVARLIPRLGSPFDHEVVATARAIERTLKSQKLDWHDVAKAVIAPPIQWDGEREWPGAESGDAQQMRAWLQAISRESWLNSWTAGFVADLLRRDSLDGLTGKQTACVNRIIRQAYDRGIRRLTDFSQHECRCRMGILAIVPEGFAADGSFNGCRAIEIIDGRLSELQLLSASRMIANGSVKLGPLAFEKAKGLPFGAALDFRAGENVDDPLRCAILTAIAVSFETDSSSLKVA